MSELFIKQGDRYRPAVPPEVCEAASKYIMEQATQSRWRLQGPRDAVNFLKYQAGLDYEQFGAVFLDARHKVIEVKPLFTGTIDGSSVHPREVVKAALRAEAKSVVLFHNHPSGEGDPSSADEIITQRLKEALALIDVRVLDHLIIAGDSVTSFAERGLI